MDKKKQPYAFRMADLVQVADEMPPWMAHFPKGERGVVMERRQSQPGYITYELYLEKSGPVSWFPEGLLTFIAHDQSALMEEWEIGNA